MKQIRETYRKTGRIHHAYALAGERQSLAQEIKNFLEQDLKFPLSGNPDFWQGEYNVFKIEDSRALNEANLNRPIKYGRKVFLLLANFITKGAQNSLLKIFEEPRSDTVFFLVMPEITGLLPTLRSRLIFGRTNKNTILSEDRDLDADIFLRAKIGKRLEMVNKIIKSIKEEKLTKSDVINFLKDIEKIIKDGLKIKNAHTARNGSLLAVEDIEKAISYVGDESPSVKVILEHLAVVL